MKRLGSKKMETNRLILRPTEEKDLKELWNILWIDTVNKYYLVSKIKEDWEEEKKWQYKKLERAHNSDVFCWTIVLKETQEVMGQISCQESENNPEDVRDVGWFLDPTFQGKGYAYEAALEVLKYMFVEVDISSIKTCCAIKNPSSWHLMEKLGFHRLKTTHFVKYTFLEDEEEVYEYECSKKEFLKEYFHKQELYITEDIDKDPYEKHITDDFVLNVTGESGSGKSTIVEIYKQDENCIVVDTDELYKKECTGDIKELKTYLQNKYNGLPDLCENFDDIYQSILEFLEKKDKMIIIDSAQYRNMKDCSLLKGDIIILRTCINTCYNRCIERYQKNHPSGTLEELAEYTTKKKNIYKWYHLLNSFIERVDRLGKEE